MLTGFMKLYRSGKKTISSILVISLYQLEPVFEDYSKEISNFYERKQVASVKTALL